MSRCLLAACMLLAWVGGVQAHTPKPLSPQDEVVGAESAQKQRDTLRETLKTSVPDNTVGNRQLSTQQKSELRQQVRQQDLESRK